MLNQIILVGRLTKDPELRETETGKKTTTITLAVPRSYKNEIGKYDTDFINCVLWTQMAETTNQYCKKGDLLGIKGRLQSRSYEDKNKQKKYVMEVIAEKIIFLQSKKDKEMANEKTEEKPKEELEKNVKDMDIAF